MTMVPMPGRRLSAHPALCSLLLWTAGLLPVHAATTAERLADLSLEQLREVVVTTVSRSEERLDRVAASVYIINGEDIRRSGATTLAEALRLAPTLDLARADANQYAISARGFNNVLANKMLVLIDGRTVYSPLFSGVFWEAQDVLLEDVERIEVVTGPSTALWGSNAVNGLIHVITRPAGATRGFAASAHAGNTERGASARFGGDAGTAGQFRLYAKSYDRSATSRANGTSVDDAAEGLQVGFRGDWTHGAQTLTLQGDAYKGRIDQPAVGRKFTGANLTARWQRSYADGAALSVQLYVDHTERHQQPAFSEVLDTVDAVAQYSFKPSPRQRVVVGGGYRHSSDRVGSSASLAFIPGSKSLNWSRVFAQDQIDLAESLALTLAASIEGNPYTRTELLPNVRLAWTPATNHTLWTSFARAVRAPSRVDRQFFTPGQPPHAIAGGPDFQSEVSNVLELGYRGQPTAALSYSVTVYQAEHSRLRSLTPSAGALQFANGIEGRTRGIETWARWRVFDAWRLDAGIVWQDQDLHVVPGIIDVGGLQALGNDPRHHESLRSSIDIGAKWRWDLDVRRVGARPAPSVPKYTAVDTRLVWKVTPTAEVMIGAQNLLDPRHAEWGPAANRVELERSFFVQLRLTQ
jgi:iron complex outermembrane receptor protein